jgi:hypothetical protein
MLLLAVLSVALYVQMKDYRDAKYRAQYVIVDGIIADLMSVAEEVTNISEGALTGDERNQSAEVQSGRLYAIERSAIALSEMYYNDLDRFVPLSFMSRAFNSSALFLRWPVSGNNWLLPNVTDLLATSGSVMQLLAGELAKGIDPARDWMNNPYSLVNRMDLVKIEQLSVQLATP